MAMAQVSVSKRMARPNPCLSLICISGTATARMNVRRSGYASLFFSCKASGYWNGSRGMTSKETQSPGKSKPSQAAPVANRTLPGAALNWAMVCGAFRPMVNSGNGRGCCFKRSFTADMAA